MRPLKLPVGTLEYVRSRIRVDNDATNPVSWLVEIAFVPRDSMPNEGDWEVAGWADPDATEPPYFAQLVPPDTSEGVKRMWVRITTGDPLNIIPIRPCGLVEFVDYTDDAH